MTGAILDRTHLEQIQQAILATASCPLDRAKALPVGAYTDPDYYTWEVEHILKQQWLCVGHSSQIPEAGDYFNLDLLGEQLAVTRDREGQINVISRTCRHRGMDLMPAAYGHPQQGNERHFICPYHRWSYDLDGRLLGAPEMAKHADFEKQRLCLPRFQCEVWEGFIFTNFSKDPLDAVGARYGGLLPALGRWQMADLEMVVSLTWDCPFNWKLLVENFMEPYHHLGAHRNTFEPIMPAAKARTEAESEHYITCHLPFADRLLEHPEEREKLFEFSQSPDLEPQDLDEYAVYLGAPSFLLFVGPDRVYWYGLQPQGPDRLTLQTTLLLRPDNKQAKTYDRALAKATEDLRKFHLEDMEAVTAVQTGIQSSFYQPGPLSHLEEPIWLFQRYLARQIASKRQAKV